MTEPLRNRLLLSLGLGTLASSGCGSNCHHPTEVTTVDVDDLLTAMEEPDTATADAGDSDTDAGDTDTDAEDTGSADTDTSEPAATCPEPSWQVRDALSAMGATWCWGEDIRLVEQVGSDCTYEYTCYVCCGYGRPYLDHAGAPVLAPTAPGRGWDESADPPDLSDLSEGERREIGGYWLQNARAEHSSVAGFHRFRRAPAACRRLVPPPRGARGSDARTGAPRGSQVHLRGRAAGGGRAARVARGGVASSTSRGRPAGRRQVARPSASSGRRPARGP